METLFAKKLKSIMSEKRYTQEEIAKIMGVKRQAISQYCNGVTVPTIDKVELLADHFEISIDYLLGRVDVPEPQKPTFKDVFLKAFSAADVDLISHIICVRTVFPCIKPDAIDCAKYRCHECWNQPYFEEEGEGDA